MFCVATHYRTTPDNVDEAVRIFRERAVPLSACHPGFRGLHLLVNKDGHLLAASCWETEEQAMAWPKSREQRKIVRLLRPLLIRRPRRSDYEVRVHVVA